nr:uncharacterized protein CI109_000914 [Kwoniella shandongensis]KAA5530734.1 hypothetical protein CI109_000914 [Kwoniella shandongensis]
MTRPSYSQTASTGRPSERSSKGSRLSQFFRGSRHDDTTPLLQSQTPRTSASERRDDNSINEVNDIDQVPSHNPTADPKDGRMSGKTKSRLELIFGRDQTSGQPRSSRNGPSYATGRGEASRQENGAASRRDSAERNDENVLNVPEPHRGWTDSAANTTGNRPVSRTGTMEEQTTVPISQAALVVAMLGGMLV